MILRAISYVLHNIRHLIKVGHVRSPAQLHPATHVMGVLSTPTYEPGLVTASPSAIILASNSTLPPPPPPPPPPVPSQAAGSSNGTIQPNTILGIVVGLGGSQHVSFHISLWGDNTSIPTLPSVLRLPDIGKLVHFPAPLLPPTQRCASDLTTTTAMDTYYPYDSPSRASCPITFDLFPQYRS